MSYDITILDGTVIDGSGAPALRADVGIVGDRIAAVGDLRAAAAGSTIDAGDRVVAPGFIDVHNHSDAWMWKEGNLLPKTSQGFTTEIIMADGISYAPVDPSTWRQWIYYLRALNGLQLAEYGGWETLAEYMVHLDRNSAQNSATHVPYGNVRTMACGFDRRVPDDVQMQEIVTGITRGMEAGAVGLSTGLDYIGHCFATTDELVEACRAIAPHGVYVSHVRYKKGTLEAIQEAVEIGRRAGVPVHISHFKGNTPEQVTTFLDYVDRVAVHEVDFTFDVYPYLPGSTMLNFFLPYEAWEDGPLETLGKLNDPTLRRRFGRALKHVRLDRVKLAWLATTDNRRYIGMSAQDYVDAVGGSPADALANLLIQENLATLMVTHHGDDALVHPFLAHEKYMMGSDGIYFPDGTVHPRLYGSAPRLLGPCVRDHRLFSLEEAVYKLSGHAAQRFGLRGRGSLREDSCADVVIFDPATVSDRATFADPHQLAVGIEHVLVNGVPVITDGVPSALKHPLPGRSLRFAPA